MRNGTLRFLAAFILVILATAVAVACGKGGNKFSPPPPAIGDIGDGVKLDVLRDDSGLPQGVRLQWAFNAQPGIRGYNIYKAEGPFFAVTGATKLNNMPVPGGTGMLAVYNDWFAAVVGHTYFYRITAVDVEGDEGTPSALVSILIRPFQFTSFSPALGPWGSTVTITGIRFGSYDAATDAVNFLGLGGSAPASIGKGRAASGIATQGPLAAEVISWTDTRIQVKVPIWTTQGNITLTVGGIGASSEGMFTATNPYLLSVLPDPVNEGQTVILSGNNFQLAPGNSTVSFGGRVIDFTYKGLVWNNTEISFPVPAGMNGPLEVWVNISGAGSTNHLFVDAIALNLPVIQNAGPEKAALGQQITISGINFEAVPGQVDFNGVVIDGASPDLISWTDTTIVVNLPSGAAQNGLITVTNGSSKTGKGWYYRCGATADPYFNYENFLVAGTKTGRGTDACYDGSFYQFFTPAENVRGILQTRIDAAGGRYEQFLFQSQSAVFAGSVGCVSVAGTIWLAYAEDGDVYVSSSTDNGISWQPSTMVSKTNGEIGWVAATDGASGYPRIAWGNITTGKVYDAYFDTNTSMWVEESLVASGYSGGEVGAATYNAATPTYFISWYNASDGHAYLLRNPGSGWTSLGSPDTSESQQALVVLNNGNPALIYHFSDMSNNIVRMAEYTGAWSKRTLANTIGQGFDAYNDGTFVWVATDGLNDGNSYMLRYNQASRSTTQYVMNSPTVNEDEYPAVAVGPGPAPYSVHTDTTAWDHWLIKWDTSGAGNHTEVNLGDGFGDLVAMGGDDHIAADMGGGVGFMFADLTYGKLYFAYHSTRLTAPPPGGASLPMGWQSYELDSGATTDFQTGGLDVADLTYHIFYQKGVELMYTTFDAGSMTPGTPAQVGSVMTGVLPAPDMAVMTGSATGSKVNVCFCTTDVFAFVQYTLRVASPTGLAGAWVIRDLDTFITAPPKGIDLIMKPDGETVVPVYYDNTSLSLVWMENSPSGWLKHPASITAGSGEYPVAEGLGPGGIEAAALNSGKGYLELLYEGSPWAQDLASSSADATTPLDFWSGIISPNTWVSMTPYFDGTFRYAVGVGSGTVYDNWLSFQLPLGDVDGVSNAVNDQGGYSLTYHGQSDPGVYFARAWVNYGG